MESVNQTLARVFTNSLNETVNKPGAAGRSFSEIVSGVLSSRDFTRAQKTVNEFIAIGANGASAGNGTVKRRGPGRPKATVAAADTETAAPARRGPGRPKGTAKVATAKAGGKPPRRYQMPDGTIQVKTGPGRPPAGAVRLPDDGSATPVAAAPKKAKAAAPAVLVAKRKPGRPKATAAPAAVPVAKRGPGRPKAQPQPVDLEPEEGEEYAAEGVDETAGVVDMDAVEAEGEVELDAETAEDEDTEDDSDDTVDLDEETEESDEDSEESEDEDDEK